MRSKKSKIIKELDPQELEGISQARVKHYLALGYSPYLDDRSHVKWLTQAQRNMRGAKSIHVPIHHRIFPKKTAVRHRKRRSRRGFLRFLQQYWVFTLILVIVISFVILILINPDLIF